MQDDQGQHDQPGASEEEAFLAGSERAQAGGGEPMPGMASFAIPVPGQGRGHHGDRVSPERFEVQNLSGDPGGFEAAPGMASFEIPIPGQGHDHHGDAVPPDEASGGWETSDRPGAPDGGYKVPAD